MICLASTLMVLDHFCGKFPTPTRWWHWPRPTGRTFTSDFVISKSYIFAKNTLPYILYYSVITQQGPTRDITFHCFNRSKQIFERKCSVYDSVHNLSTIWQYFVRALMYCFFQLNFKQNPSPIYVIFFYTSSKEYQVNWLVTYLVKGMV